ncbi:hypothetical protein SNOUR_41610 [Streptomyces noursei ATCC 11455]|nr:hypothetical protein SNOUR_41610 [Streptomyces noursei ATCC 11455]
MCGAGEGALALAPAPPGRADSPDSATPPGKPDATGSTGCRRSEARPLPVRRPAVNAPGAFGLGVPDAFNFGVPGGFGISSRPIRGRSGAGAVGRVMP